MDVTRRDFLKISGAATAGLMLGSIFDLKPIKAYAVQCPPVWEDVTVSICCYCAVGCGLLVGTHVDDPYVDSATSEHVTYVQGDPDHPINQGSLCSKGQAVGQLRTIVDCNAGPSLNPKRLTQPLYRAAGATSWTPVSWNTALDGIAAKIKATRDATCAGAPTYTEFIDVDPLFGGPGDYPVNRCPGIACLGGAAHDTEECYLLVKLTRALGLVYIEHQARI